MATKSKWYYRISRESGGSRDVQHLTIEVYSAADRLSCSSTEALLQFEWQSHREGNLNDFRAWYGFHIQIANCSRLQELEDATKLARRILRSEDSWEEYSPRELLDRLNERLGARRVVYDRRVSRLVPVDELAPDTISCWIDDYRAMGRQSCQVGVLAVNQAEAQAEMLQEALRLGYEDWLADFIRAGKPVFIRDRGGPDWEPLGDLLFVGGDPDAVCQHEGEL